MALREEIYEIENKLGFSYPPSFASSIEGFAVLFGSERFRQAFYESSLLLSVAEIVEARKDVPDGLIPFMRNEQPSVSDIYALEPDSNNIEFRVVVWSGHAIVMEWENFRFFVLWVKEHIAKHATVA